MPHVVVKSFNKTIEEAAGICPVKCFHKSPEGEYVINGEECIDCGACEGFVEEGAIVSDSDATAEDVSYNNEKSQEWPQCV